MAGTRDGNDDAPEADEPGPRRRVFGLIARIGLLPLALGLGVGALGGLGAFTFGYGEGAAYLSNDPAACPTTRSWPWSGRPPTARPTRTSRCSR
jgi:cytochrome c nitrite reductase small subunit